MGAKKTPAEAAAADHKAAHAAASGRRKGTGGASMPPEDGAPLPKASKKVPVRKKAAEAANMSAKPAGKAPRGSQVQAGATGAAAAAGAPFKFPATAYLMIYMEAPTQFD